MTKTVVIHQPDFAPYLGFFHRFLHADFYIVLDHVQFVNSNRGWTHRDKIKTSMGEKWLSLSVKKAPRDTPINAIELATSTDWITDNQNLLRQNYRKASGFEEVMPQVEALYREPPLLMRDFNLRWLEAFMDMLDVRIPFVLSSSLEPEGQKNELLIDLLGKVGASHYLSGLGARNYMEPEKFSEAGISLLWQEFDHPAYPQQFGEFIPYLSILDIFFNCGVSGARALLRSCK